MHVLIRTRRLLLTWLSVRREKMRFKEVPGNHHGCLKFNVHSFRLASKVEGVAALLGHLLSNIGGPRNKVRYLYTKLKIHDFVRVIDLGTTHQE